MCLAGLCESPARTTPKLTTTSLGNDHDRMETRLHQVEEVMGRPKPSPDAHSVQHVAQLARQTTESMTALHEQLCEAYAARLPDLPRVAPDAVTCAEVVRLVGNRAAPLPVRLFQEAAFPPTLTLELSVACAQLGPPLAHGSEVEALAERILELARAQKRLLRLQQQLLPSVAPNICALLGASLAAQVVNRAGGLDALACMPTDTIRLVGKEEVCRVDAREYHGLLYRWEGIREVLRGGMGGESAARRLVRQVANKLSLAVRRDCFGDASDAHGPYGQQLRQQLREYGDRLGRGVATAANVDATTRVKALPRPREWEHRQRRAGRKRTRRRRRARLEAQQQRIAGRRRLADLDAEPPADVELASDSSSMASAESWE